MQTFPNYHQYSTSNPIATSWHPISLPNYIHNYISIFLRHYKYSPSDQNISKLTPLFTMKSQYFQIDTNINHQIQIFSQVTSVFTNKTNSWQPIRSPVYSNYWCIWYIIQIKTFTNWHQYLPSNPKHLPISNQYSPSKPNISTNTNIHPSKPYISFTNTIFTIKSKHFPI